MVRPGQGLKSRAGTRSVRQVRRLLILVLVLLFHGLAFWMMAHRVPQIGALRTSADDSRAIELELLPRFAPAPATPQAGRTARRPRLAELPPALPPSALPPSAQQRPLPAPVLPDNQAVQGRAQDDAVRNALRSIVGCGDADGHGLTREQKANCFRKARPTAPIPNSLSPAEQAAFDADKKREPWLVRTPHNGCEPRVADRPSILAGRGGTGSAAASTEGGVSCAWSF